MLLNVLCITGHWQNRTNESGVVQSTNKISEKDLDISEKAEQLILKTF